MKLFMLSERAPTPLDTFSNNIKSTDIHLSAASYKEVMQQSAFRTKKSKLIILESQ